MKSLLIVLIAILGEYCSPKTLLAAVLTLPWLLSAGLRADDWPPGRSALAEEPGEGLPGRVCPGHAVPVDRRRPPDPFHRRETERLRHRFAEGHRQGGLEGTG